MPVGVLPGAVDVVAVGVVAAVDSENKSVGELS
jgi:hypothetical protein